MGLTVAELEQEVNFQGAAQIGLLAEVADARGTAGTLGARLDVALNPDGTPRTSVTAAAFVTEVAPIIAYPPAGEYVALKGDLTAVYVAKRRLRINGALLPYVTSSTYNAGGDYTVVNFSTPVSNSITSVEYSFDPAAMPPLHYSGNPDIEQVVSGISTFATKHLSDAQYKGLLDDILARVTITSLASVDDGAGVDLVGRAFKYVDIIDDLRTLTPTGAPVYVQCGAIIGDGYHGTFQWDDASTEEDDGQNTIAVTGVPTGRWKRNIDPSTDGLSTHINRTTVHGATAEATASRIVLRDADGRARFAPGVASGDAVNVGQLGNHAALISAHGATADATAGRLVVRDSAGRASFAPGTTGGEAVVFSQFVSSFADPGYFKLPGGLIIQWGSYTSGYNQFKTYSWPIAFPSACLAAVGQIASGFPTHQSTITVRKDSATQFSVAGYDGNYIVSVIGIGY